MIRATGVEVNCDYYELLMKVIIIYYCYYYNVQIEITMLILFYHYESF